MPITRLLKTSLILGSLTLAACANTAPTTPTHDGLVRQAETKFDELYLRPSASLAGYSSYGLEPCEVSFRKNWLRDQNTQRLDLSNRVTQRNVDKIKDSMGEQCNKYLREALEEGAEYPLVDNFQDGEAVLVLRPKIINLDINAPDTDGPGINRSFTTSFGEMTLLLEIADATTGEVLARAVDKRRGPEHGQLRWTNGITNKAESDRILKRWANLLRESLDNAVGNS